MVGIVDLLLAEARLGQLPGQTPLRLNQQAIADGATAPAPSASLPAVIWSTLTNCVLEWDGARWKKRQADDIDVPGIGSISAGALTTVLTNILALISGPGSTLGNYQLSGTLMQFVDNLQRVLLRIQTDGTLIAKLGLSVGTSNGLAMTTNSDGSYSFSLGTTPGVLPVGQGGIDSRRQMSGNLYEWLDANQNLLAYITAYGQMMGNILPTAQAYGGQLLAQTLYKLKMIAAGASIGGSPAQCIICFAGDSYTNLSSRYVSGVTNALQTLYGNAGGGWMGFGKNGSIVNGSANGVNTFAMVGTWDTSAYYTGASPDLAAITSTTPGDTITCNITGNVGAGTGGAVTLFYTGGGSGVVNYTVNGGAPVTLNLTGAGAQTAALAGIPSNGSCTVVFTVVSGTVTVSGVNCTLTNAGVIVHKLGATGSTSAHWANTGAADWQAGITALNPDWFSLFLGTNDQASILPGAFATNLQTVLTRALTAAPKTDRVLVTPPENGLARSLPMPALAAVAYQIAARNGCGYLNAQYRFGPASNPGLYMPTGARPLFNVDLKHPEPTLGGYVLQDMFLRYLQYGC